MEYKFKKYNSLATRVIDKVSVTKSGYIGFPTYFYNRYDLKTYKYAILYYDSEKEAIGIQFSNDEGEKHKLSLTRSGKYGANLSAVSFFKSNGIDTKIYKGRYDYKKEWIEGIGNLFVIHISKEGGTMKKVERDEDGPVG